MEFVDLKSQYRALKVDIDARMQRVLDHGQYIMGPEVAELELALAKYAGSRHCITCASGTEALLMSLMAIGVQAGDEVITTPFTFAATVETIVLLGARPVFVDIEPDTCLINADRIEEAITDRTRAIIPVSLYGQVCDMDAIQAIAHANGNIPVIEDAAQSFGATYRDRHGVQRRSCNLSAIGCASFFPSKPLGCYGDGGAVFTDDEDLARVLRQIRVHGQERRYLHVRVGLGGRMDTLQCAVVLAKLQRFDWELQRRREIATDYLRLIAASGADVKLPAVRAGRESSWAQFTVQVGNREAVRAAMAASDVPTAVHYPLSLNRQPAYSNMSGTFSTPNSDRAADTVLSLPMSADLTDADKQHVVDALVGAIG